MLEGDDAVVVLEALWKELVANSFSGRITVTGPLPIASDSAKACELFREQRMRIYDWVKDTEHFSYAHVGEVISDANGVIRPLLHSRGLSHQGIGNVLFALNNV